MTARPKPTEVVHYIGGLSYTDRRNYTTSMLAGWVVCCYGPKCERLTATAPTTRDPAKTTCAACRRLLVRAGLVEAPAQNIEAVTADEAATILAKCAAEPARFLPKRLAATVRGLSFRVEALIAEHQALTDERDRLARACVEGLPREVLPCPECGRPHVDGADGTEYGTKPHHTHQCHHCGHVWDVGRWSFGVEPRS